MRCFFNRKTKYYNNLLPKALHRRTFLLSDRVPMACKAVLHDPPAPLPQVRTPAPHTWLPWPPWPALLALALRHC
jgi:hypothetical protein